MIDFEYLSKGLCGLARAHRAGPMAGHLGAAVTAGYLLGEEQPNLDERVCEAIERDLDRIMAGAEAIWFNPQKAGVTIPELFAPFPAAPAKQERIDSIATALAGNIGKLRQSGHNVIFASISLRALHDHPDFATEPIVSGIQKLIRTFDNQAAGRGYFGKDRGWIIGDKIPRADDDSLPAFDSEQAMVGVVIDELIQSASRRRQGFGGLFHVINHTAGLVELARFGYPDLAREGRGALRRHLQLHRALPDLEEELGKLKRAEHDPRTPAYWQEHEKSQWSAQLTHRIKTLYGLSVLTASLEDAAKKGQAWDAFRYLAA